MAYCSRKPTRIPGYDYSSENYYFVTICTHEKKCIFGTTDKLNKFGEIAKEDIRQIESHFDNVHIDHFIIMPNHIHMIIVLSSENRVSLSHVIGLYKSGVSRKIRKLQPELNVWQRSFHDHIIRNQQEYENIWQYIQYNDQKWAEDCFYPSADEA